MKYIFRGLLVLEYDENTGKLVTDLVAGTDMPVINFCNYIDEDFEIMENFFRDIKLFREGRITKLKDIVVD